ncbi:3-phosphoserine/phosphohydroxythreonine transaminase [Parvibium lacunae]|uniref:Phosphoserine aminotransferase n=1 Tax=Parvibium lacunae TaxID=1888893 RepID=A0A368L4G2_9BURK|nr:3-phosphoserine/phosphohydroxythreonine transaminase [Parvibium lacunae]RCS58457.1 3-phosphoserine/phosphohydroxythreonine transaminase [Parvibium lacunae]
MSRVYNFSAGPAALPEPVLRKAAAEMLDWCGSGQSVMEMSHRGPDYMSIHAQAQQDLRDLLNIPDSYKILFLQGGGTTQFEMVPINLLRGKGKADYVITGEWSKRAAQEARAFCQVNVVADSANAKGQHTFVPKQSDWKLKKDAAYVHVCTNETLGGVEYHWTPDTGKVPLVADMSSHILSKQIDVSKYGLIYAGAQKNIGPAGLVLVIVREDLIGHAVPTPPPMFNYKVHADHDSMLNTPPTYSIYMAGLVFQWLKQQGGVAEMEKRNIQKANLLYDALDRLPFYSTKVNKGDRSRMNVPFTLPDARLDEAFLAGAKERGMVQLKGHRLIGGMRASIYNAMPLSGVETLVAYLNEFAQKNG